MLGRRSAGQRGGQLLWSVGCVALDPERMVIVEADEAPFGGPDPAPHAHTGRCLVWVSFIVSAEHQGPAPAFLLLVIPLIQLGTPQGCSEGMGAAPCPPRGPRREVLSLRGRLCLTNLVSVTAPSLLPPKPCAWVGCHHHDPVLLMGKLRLRVVKGPRSLGW